MTPPTDRHPGVELRLATVDDADEIGAMHVRSWQVAYRGMIPDAHLDALDPVARAERWRSILAGSSDTVVAVRDGAIAAFASSGADRDDPTRGEVWAIYADPPAWGTGAGHAVMGRAVEHLAARGYGEAVLWVIDVNERARAFYAREGWAPDGGVRVETIGDAPIREVRLRRTLG